MAFGFEGIVRRIEWLEKMIRLLQRLIGELQDKLAQLQLPNNQRAGGLDFVVLKPSAAVAPATLHADGTTIVPTIGTGTLKGRPDQTNGNIPQTAVVVSFDHINERETIPATAKYVICVRNGNRLQAWLWDCGA